MSGWRYCRIIYLAVSVMAIFTSLQFSAAIDDDNSVKCTKMNPCCVQGYTCAFKHAGDSEGVCVIGQENRVSHLLPSETVTQLPTEKKGQQGTSPVVRTDDDPPKTSSSCTLSPLPVLFHSQPAEVFGAAFQPESEPSDAYDPRLASDTLDHESTLSDTPFSPDSMNPKSITVFEPPHENNMNNMRRLPSEVTTGSQEAASANTDNQHTDRKKETIKPTQSRFQEIRRRQREVLKTLMAQMEKEYGEQLGMVMMTNKRESRLMETKGHQHEEAGLKNTDEHIHKETEHREVEMAHKEAGVKKTDPERCIRTEVGPNSMMGAQNSKMDREKRFSEFENQEHIWDDIEEDWSDTWDVPEDWNVPSDEDQNVNALAEPDFVNSPVIDHANGNHDTEYKTGPLLEELAYGTEEDSYPLLYDAHLDDSDMAERKKGSPTLESRATRLHPLFTLTSVLIIIVLRLAVLC